MRHCILCKRRLWPWQKRVENLDCHSLCFDVWSSGFASALKGGIQAGIKLSDLIKEQSDYLQ